MAEHGCMMEERRNGTITQSGVFDGATEGVRQLPTGQESNPGRDNDCEICLSDSGSCATCARSNPRGVGRKI